MDPTKLGLEALMDAFKEDALINLMVRLLENIHDCCDEIQNDATKVEVALRHLLRRIDQNESRGLPTT